MVQDPAYYGELLNGCWTQCGIRTRLLSPYFLCLEAGGEMSLFRDASISFYATFCFGNFPVRMVIGNVVLCVWPSGIGTVL